MECWSNRPRLQRRSSKDKYTVGRIEFKCEGRSFWVRTTHNADETRLFLVGYASWVVFWRLWLVGGFLGKNYPSLARTQTLHPKNIPFIFTFPQLSQYSCLEDKSLRNSMR
jgi:hypothetical protein